MHVEDPPGPRTLVQVVDVLGDHEQVVPELLLQSRERHVGRVGPDCSEGATTGVVELVDQPGVCVVRLGSGDVLEPVALPEPVGVAERRHPALRGDAGSREHDDLHAFDVRCLQVS